ncbi:MAG: hypothetical protein GXO39_06160 [Thermotogae bacterium]|nr:hypothetical protein [Thermotogota bacterium]
MRYLLAALLLGASTSVLYGQAMSYLGINIGTQGMYTGFQYDSLYISSSGSTVNNYSVAETLSVDYDFTFMGYPARGVTKKTYRTGSTTDTTILVDTVYEISNDLHRLMIIGKTDPTTYFKLDVLAIVTPLTVGSSWQLGITDTTIVADVDGDGDYSVLDTLRLTVDSAYVVNMGSMTVPAGTFDSVYTIYIKLRGDLWSSAVYAGTGSSSSSWSETMLRDYYIYWKPGLGYIKDSMYQYADWSYLFVSIESYKWSVNELVDYNLVRVAERRSTEKPDFVVTRGGILVEEKATVFDASGRVVFYGKGFVKLSKGIYFVREGARIKRVLVR